MLQFTCISCLSLKYRTQHQNIPYCFVFTCSGYVFRFRGWGLHKNYNRKTLYLITICNKLWHICEFMKEKKPYNVVLFRGHFNIQKHLRMEYKGNCRFPQYEADLNILQCIYSSIFFFKFS